VTFKSQESALPDWIISQRDIQGLRSSIFSDSVASDPNRWLQHPASVHNAQRLVEG
jgi:hypothetical protein